MHCSPQINKIVLATGWNCPDSLMQPLADALAVTFDARIEFLDIYNENINELSQLTENFTLLENTLLIGWSLGGLVLNHLAQQQPDKVTALITLATNREFVNNQTGMDEDTFTAFYQGFSDNAALTTKRFQGLIANSRDERKTLKSLYSDFELNKDLALSRLKWLQDYQLQKINVPWYAILAGADNLVPKTAKTPLKQLADQVEMIDEASHMFFHSDIADEIIEKITAYVKTCHSIAG
jgi:pimeloyl-[acyl-carrier protein] methyl ester esterase